MGYQDELNKIRVSDNFILSEFECKHCGAVKLHPKLLELLEKFRARVRKPIIITSGYRCEEHNKKIGGAPNSRHLYGDAVDIDITRLGLKIEELVKIAEEVGFTGIGIYDDGHIHLDTRPGNRAFWDDRRRGGK